MSFKKGNPMKPIYKIGCILGMLIVVTSVNANLIPLTAEIRNEQPYSLDNNTIRIRVFNHSMDTLKELSFCYRFHANKEFIFEHDWYLPNLNYKIDTLTDTTYQIHFWLKQNASVAPNKYFPNKSGIVFGLHYRYWFPWEHQLDYSFSSNPSFENTEKLFLSMTNECYDETVVIDTARIKILGYDKDGNGVRDDLDSLIDANIPDSPEKRAAYRYLAQAIQNQWIAFYDNPQMTYEEMRPYAVFTSLGIELIAESNAESSLDFSLFEARLFNTMERIMFGDKIDRIFIGNYLPVAVKSDRQYANLVDTGMNGYNEILRLERMK
ncbi:MAG: hypothetical protein IK012_03830 [Fibrobacter sp.]|uniref:hypothetical protein n=1 Tax=Fibrobacter sp. TaxID=35828 RepID=UPI0025C26CEC|nr:hypothetical protein [Fibrobacter sp.]MBR4784367.1 hypothetical protein [Fibrobacter sp.]